MIGVEIGVKDDVFCHEDECYAPARYGYRGYCQRHYLSDLDTVMRVVVRPLSPLKQRERGQIILVTQGGVTEALERVE